MEQFKVCNEILQKLQKMGWNAQGQILNAVTDEDVDEDGKLDKNLVKNMVYRLSVYDTNTKDLIYQEDFTHDEFNDHTQEEIDQELEFIVEHLQHL